MVPEPSPSFPSDVDSRITADRRADGDPQTRRSPVAGPGIGKLSPVTGPRPTDHHLLRDLGATA
ncbi:GDSL family lipase, partial [Gordonia sp. i37]